MAFNKRVYGAGEPCDRCQTPTVPGKTGYYCKACYIAWKNQSGTNTPAPSQNAPQASFDTIQNDIQVKIDELNVTISRMRVSFASMDERIKTLETLAIGANKIAFDLHSPSVSHTDIPIIQATDGDKINIEFPEGFLKV